MACFSTHNERDVQEQYVYFDNDFFEISSQSVKLLRMPLSFAPPGNYPWCIIKRFIYEVVVGGFVNFVFSTHTKLSKVMNGF